MHGCAELTGKHGFVFEGASWANHTKAREPASCQETAVNISNISRSHQVSKSVVSHRTVGVFYIEVCKFVRVGVSRECK